MKVHHHPPPVSTSPVANLPLVSTTEVANLPLVSTTPAANNENNIRLLTPYSELDIRYEVAVSRNPMVLSLSFYVPS